MIPKTFVLVNRKWLVRHVTTKQLQAHLDKHWPDDPVDASNISGLCDPAVCRIFLNKDKHHTEGDLFHTFFHELYHALLYADGQQGHDEELVDRMGGYLAQYHSTRK